MYEKQLRTELTKLAHNFGENHFYENYEHSEIKCKTAVIFKEVQQNFHPKSWATIQNNPDFFQRTKKEHSHFKGILPIIYEMQSSNSSDALAMNIFCYPKFGSWKGVKNLLKFDKIPEIKFGFEAKVIRGGYDYPEPDFTEVDINLKDEIIGECKLTEEDFTSKVKSEVEYYASFKEVFHIHKLPQSQSEYYNYQLIRNILAAKQHKCRFILFCDMRRPDLAKSFFQTVCCIKDDFLELRTKCEIIYWQDLAQVVGKDLKDFLNEKYGI